MHEHHMFPKAHAIINNINSDKMGRVALCFECHKRLHNILGQADKFIGELYIEKTRGKDDNTKTITKQQFQVLFDSDKE